MNIDNLSLDQLRVFLAVIEEGSFSGAGRRFGRAQSAVSYSIATLEQQLGVELFDRASYRPLPTPVGQALTGQIVEIIARADRLKSQAHAMSKGLEPEVALAADVMFPGAFSRNFTRYSPPFPCDCLSKPWAAWRNSFSTAPACLASWPPFRAFPQRSSAMR